MTAVPTGLLAANGSKRVKVVDAESEKPAVRPG
jgi:hypothetical protein